MPAMQLEPWWKNIGPEGIRPEVREGRSFNPDEFAIALEQVVAGKEGNAPEDYRDPVKFFSRTVWTRALRDHVGMVLRRLTGQTGDTAAVMTLVTQFGGGKTHTLTALYHIAANARDAEKDEGVRSLFLPNGLKRLPDVKVAVFVGNAWDPKPGRETPWIDIARQLAGDAGVKALGTDAKDSPPGTETLAEVYRLAGKPVLILFDEVLNFTNRKRAMAEPFLSFLHNLTVSMTGTTNCAAVISLPRSQVEMTEWDEKWQSSITKVVRRVARDLIVNDEGEVALVVKRRLFEDLTPKQKDKMKEAAKAYADWCFEHRNELPDEWRALDSGASDAKAREVLRARFEACYPFHPATLSVFQRKWQTVPQYQQTRGTLAMLAQWVSWAFRDGWEKARKEGFITLGSAPLHVPGFRATVLGQLGESRLIPALQSDLVGDTAHAKAMDADTKGPLADIHRRVGTAIFFESSGGMTNERVARLPDLVFALGEPGLDTTSVHTAASKLEARAFYLRRVGSDGYRFGFKPTLRKVVAERRSSLDEKEVEREEQAAIEKEFKRASPVPVICAWTDPGSVGNTDKLTLVVVGPSLPWSEPVRPAVATWSRQRSGTDRDHPATLVWCMKKAGHDLRLKVETAKAWRKVQDELGTPALAGEFDTQDRLEVKDRVREAEAEVRDEVWASYRFAAVLDPEEKDGLHIIDLGAGHASSSETLAGRVLEALRRENRLNEGVASGYIYRHWPKAFAESQAWPLAALRKQFLDGTLTRLVDAEATLRQNIPAWVEKGEFGLADGPQPGGTFRRLFFREFPATDEVAFDNDTFLVTRARSEALKGQPPKKPEVVIDDRPPERPPEPPTPGGRILLEARGTLPPEMWNRFGNRIIPVLKQGEGATILVSLQTNAPSESREQLEREVKRILADLGLGAQWRVEVQSGE